MIDKRKTIGLVVSLGLLIVFFSWSKWVEGRTKGTIVLNEICAHNFSIIEEKYQGYSDYVEIYNAGTENVSLKDYGLSQERGKKSYVFPDIELSPGGFLVVFAVGEDLETEEKIFANFRISDGDSIYLVDGQDHIIDNVTIEGTANDIVLAREQDGAGEWKTMTGTPYASNTMGRYQYVPCEEVAAPILSAESGFYEAAFELSIEAEEKEIHYTLDGSLPDEDSPRYDGNIYISDRSGEKNQYCDRNDFTEGEKKAGKPVDKATIIRAVAIDRQGRISRETVGTYFVGKHYGEKYPNHLILSLTADPEDLFGQDGIYVLGRKYEEYLENLEKLGEEAGANGIDANFMQRGREWERGAWIDGFSGDGTPILHQKVGIRIHGSSTRKGEHKSFKLYAREQYDGHAYLLEDLLGTGTREKRLLVRYGVGRSQFLQSLIQGDEVVTQHYRPCLLFLNGEFWGIYSIQERIDEEFLAEKYHLQVEDIVVQKGEEIAECSELQQAIE